MCIWSSLDVTKTLSQMLYWYGLSPVCVLISFKSLYFLENLFLQRKHWCFPSVCYHMSCKLIFSGEFVITKITLIWCFPSVCYDISCSSSFLVNLFSKKVHWYDFFPSVCYMSFKVGISYESFFHKNYIDMIYCQCVSYVFQG